MTPQERRLVNAVIRYRKIKYDAHAAGFPNEWRQKVGDEKARLVEFVEQLVWEIEERDRVMAELRATAARGEL